MIVEERVEKDSLKKNTLCWVIFSIVSKWAEELNSAHSLFTVPEKAKFRVHYPGPSIHRNGPGHEIHHLAKPSSPESNL